MYSKRRRERKILIDYLRNNRTNTSISAYSPRARPGARVSVPLDWSELNSKPDRWTLLTVARRLDRLHKDPWAGYWAASQLISNASVKALANVVH
jgi:bifunctional non-homologous end joining protein LigD